MVHDGLSVAETARVLNVSRSLVADRCPAPSARVPKGSRGQRYKNRALGMAELMVLFRLFEHNDTLYISEALHRFQAQTGLVVSRSTLMRGIAQLQLTYKSVRCRLHPVFMQTQPRIGGLVLLLTHLNAHLLCSCLNGPRRLAGSSSGPFAGCAGPGSAGTSSSGQMRAPWWAPGPVAWTTREASAAH